MVGGYLIETAELDDLAVFPALVLAIAVYDLVTLAQGLRVDKPESDKRY